jgi:hypothetical protein
MTQKEVRLQLRSPQIEVTIFETQVFGCKSLGTRVELKRRRARVVER